MKEDRPDVIVVGGGSCGCVVAARLSEDPSRTVLLIEAGPGSAPAEPEEIRDATRLPVGPSSPWTFSYQAQMQPGSERTIARGRVLGGSGAINGGYFIRGTPADFDGWGSPLWTYAAVLPYFRASEHDADFTGCAHGSDGPMPIARQLGDAQHPITRTFTDAARAAGFRDDPDKNDAASGVMGGVGPVPLNVVDGHRISAATAYLRPVSVRPNLSVLTDSTVVVILFRGTTAVGVELVQNGIVSQVFSDLIVLSAGAVRTPHLLMLSGVGSSKDIAAQGIGVTMDLPAVGADFSDHPEIALSYSVKPEAARGGTSPLQAVLHIDDLELRPYTASFGSMIAGVDIPDPILGVGLMRPESRGRITMRSPDPSAPPLVEYRYLESSRDRAAMRSGVAHGLDLLRSQAMSSVVRSVEEWTGDDEMNRRLGTSLHLSGSCAMGTGPESVVDERCRVHGIDGLRIVDTSVMPRVTSRGPHATAIMIAERASALIAADFR